MEIQAGRLAYRSIDTTLRLTEIMRQRGLDDVTSRFKDALESLRVGDLSEESWRLLTSRAAFDLSAAEVEGFDQALRLYFTKDEVRDFNYRQLEVSGQPVKRIKAVHEPAIASKAHSDDADNLDGEFNVAIGCRVMLTSNLWVENGLVNGSMGTVHDLVWKPGSDPSISSPFVILCKFDNYDLERPTYGDTGAVPIFQKQSKFEYNNCNCSRTQFPLRVAYAITVYKSQGLTLPRVVLNFSKKDFAPGLSYVALSRVKKLDGIMFETALNLDRFSTSESDFSRDRTNDQMARTRHIPTVRR